MQECHTKKKLIDCILIIKKFNLYSNVSVRCRYFTFSLGDDEAKFGYLGVPGVNAEAINEDKLKELESMMQGKEWP